MMATRNYCEAILDGFDYCLSRDAKCFTIGQGLWSPWYVGRSMDGLDRKYGRSRVIDTPVSEQATTGMAIGAALQGYRPIVIHPRMDFMILAMDQIVNQAAKWRHMLGGQVSPSVVIRAIVNRGGEQGAQHSQALHAWLAHVPGLRVAMPATARDARDLLIGAVQSPDPVIYIDDRWLYDEAEELGEAADVDLAAIRPELRQHGNDITLVAASHSFKRAKDAAAILKAKGFSADLIDLRVVNPIEPEVILKSVRKTGRLLVVDGGWSNCGLAGEIIALAATGLRPDAWRSAPARITLPDAPAPTSAPLEKAYYPGVDMVAAKALQVIGATNIA